MAERIAYVCEECGKLAAEGRGSAFRIFLTAKPERAPFCPTHRRRMTRQPNRPYPANPKEPKK
jgi:hypothetical protein